MREDRSFAGCLADIARVRLFEPRTLNVCSGFYRRNRTQVDQAAQNLGLSVNVRPDADARVPILGALLTRYPLSPVGRVDDA